MIEKRNVLKEDSCSDFDMTKKAEYYDEEGLFVADEANKDMLIKPKKIDYNERQ